MGSGNSTSASSASNNQNGEIQQTYKKEWTGNDTTNTQVDVKANANVNAKAV